MPYKQLPTWYRERPELCPELHPMHVAFWRLSTERQLGMSCGPIPESKIREYATEELGLDQEAARIFRDQIRAMDRAYLKWTRDEQEKKARQ